jgi:two-component system phosphate regulon response regulator PhoB
MLMAPLETTRLEVLPKILQEKKLGGSRIMIVDDDVDLLEELKKMLSHKDYMVEVIPNSALAFELACSLKPDLIITDLKMEPKSGFQLADELRNSFKTKSIPIIAITGYFNKKEHGLMMKMVGIMHPILKPFTPQDLISAIEAVLKKVKFDPDGPAT